MKNKNLRLNDLSIKSFVTSIDSRISDTVKGGALEDTSDSVVTCDTNYNCTKFPPCEFDQKREDRRR